VVADGPAAFEDETIEGMLSEDDGGREKLYKAMIVSLLTIFIYLRKLRGSKCLRRRLSRNCDLDLSLGGSEI
jgi:hypothetical protein